ncbi:colicin immunity domain-containing protein [Streptomyces sp. NPDC048603]|uniref:colicin immunity domain-containing protein n=1 Tax=Streptomyces sp. NPDC048603 TaxID=3365577 RepID=UPI0037188EEA
MRQFAEGRIPPDVFAVGWLGARRAAMESGERVAERIGRPLDQVFYALDDYPIDPRFREEGDTTDEQLMACVQEQVGRIGG